MERLVQAHDHMPTTEPFLTWMGRNVHAFVYVHFFARDVSTLMDACKKEQHLLPLLNEHMKDIHTHLHHRGLLGSERGGMLAAQSCKLHGPSHV
jgi:streptomycin 6-kinase